MPADETPTDAQFPKPVSTESPSPLALMPDARPAATMSSFQETWEDIRDAVTETDVYIATSEKVTAVSRVASSAWSLSKKLAWVLGTSALVLVVPLLYEIDKELGPGFDPAQPAPPAATASTAAADSPTTSAPTTASTYSTSS